MLIFVKLHHSTKALLEQAFDGNLYTFRWKTIHANDIEEDPVLLCMSLPRSAGTTRMSERRGSLQGNDRGNSRGRYSQGGRAPRRVAEGYGNPFPGHNAAWYC